MKKTIQSIDNREIYDLPVVPLKEIIALPTIFLPVLVGRQSSLKAVEEAYNSEKEVFLVLQKNPDVENPTIKDLHKHGVVCKISQTMTMPDGKIRMLVEGGKQAKLEKVRHKGGTIRADVTVPEITFANKNKFPQMIHETTQLFVKYCHLNPFLPKELVGAITDETDELKRIYLMLSGLDAKAEEKQPVLDATTLELKAVALIKLISDKSERVRIEKELDDKVQDTMNKTQRQFIIQEQIRALQNELGEDFEASPDLAKIFDAIKKSGMPKLVHEKALEEMDKLRKTPAMSPEFAVSRNYLEWLAAVPWSITTDDNLNVHNVKEVLDEDHYGLEKAKERITEYIAVLSLVKEINGQILCLVGPPGVGKTSLGKSIARALGRNFVRISLGGVRDEADIRGHRKTYIGSMPGKIIQAMKKAGVVNPVILLDEIDKMSNDFRGDPASAMLEVLDPEQNNAFNDHYLEVDYDLSKVLFITTANVLHQIPLPLQDRMEIIQLSGYTDYDKIEIAKRHIIPKQISEHGLANFNIIFQEEAIRKIILEYTSEAGVRSLERQIASVCRKIAMFIVSKYPEVVQPEITNINNDDGAKKTKKVNGRKKVVSPEQDESKPDFMSPTVEPILVTPQLIEDYLKVPTYRDNHDEHNDMIGAANGLAWTSTGGDTLTVEVSIVPGTEKLTLTGQLGDVMKESVTAAITYIRGHTSQFGVPEAFYKGQEIHVHVPEGAIPKDGPSAGITMAVAVVSAAAQKPVRWDVAMTGEITLRGKILQIGGLTEKLIAAKRAKIKTVIIPKDNLKDLAEIPTKVTDGLEIIAVSYLAEAIPYIFR